MREADHVYFARRALEERQAADRASSERARTVHAQLAQHYAELAKALEAAGDSRLTGFSGPVEAMISIET